MRKSVSRLARERCSLLLKLERDEEKSASRANLLEKIMSNRNEP